MKEPGLSRDYSNYGLPQCLDSLPLPTASWVTFTAYCHQHQREGRGNQGRRNSNESTVPLVSSSAPKYTRGGGCNPSMSFNPLCYSCSPCCLQHRVGCMEMICGMKEERRGKFPPTAASSKKRKGNYMLSGSMPHRLVHILLNKLMFGSILSPQN